MTTDWDTLTRAASATGSLAQPPQPEAAKPTTSELVAAFTIPLETRQRLKAEGMPEDSDGVLMLWGRSKKLIAEATAFEMEMRKLAVQLKVPENTRKEGVNNVELGGGYTLKATLNYSYNLKSDKEGVAVIDAIDNVIDDFVKLSNEGSFIAERLFKWKVELSVSEYRLLVEAAKTSEPAAKMLARLEQVLEIKDKAPVLEIKEPKVKK